MQMSVVMNAIFSDRHRTVGKTGSEKKRAKFSKVNCSVSVLLPCLVKAYRTIISIGSTIMIAAQTIYGRTSLAKDFMPYFPILPMTWMSSGCQVRPMRSPSFS